MADINWFPDVCQCAFVINTDTANVKLISPIRVCANHLSLSNPNKIFDAVLNENRMCSSCYDMAVYNILAISRNMKSRDNQDIILPDGRVAKTLIDEAAVEWSFSGIGAKRVLKISFGKLLTQIDKGILQNLYNVQFGIGKVDLV